MPQTLRPDNVLVMNNLSHHKKMNNSGSEFSVRGKVRFLPANSHDLNPIEKMWSKIKTLLRGAGARNQTTLVEAVASSSLTPQDAAS